VTYREPDKQRRDEAAREALLRQKAEEEEIAEARRAFLRWPRTASKGLATASLVVSSAGLGLPVALLVFNDVFAQSRSSRETLVWMILLAGSACAILGLILAVGALLWRSTGRMRAGLAILLGLVAVPASFFCAFCAAWSAPLPSGRPLRVGGRRVLPRVVRGCRRARTLMPPGVDRPDPELVHDRARRRLAKLWLIDARAEHASVTAFERLGADLVAVGAPFDLVVRARRAALEEVEHANACFAVASVYAGRELGASPRPLAPARAERPTARREQLLRLAVESLLDGCVAEGMAASVAREGSQGAVDPAIGNLLARIAREEATHAELARDIVAWIVGEEPSLAPTLRAAVVTSRLPKVSHPDSDEDVLAAHGRPPARRVRVLLRQAQAQALASLPSHVS
jgi:hypothetical protein